MKTRNEDNPRPKIKIALARFLSFHKNTRNKIMEKSKNINNKTLYAKY